MLTVSNPKTHKGEALGYLTGILHLAPSKTVCPNATRGCLAACLNTAGRGRTTRVQNARKRKTDLFHTNRDAFMAELDKPIAALVRKAARMNLKPAVRLNGTSDIAWETIRDASGDTVFDRWPDIQFYDYTKSYDRARAEVTYSWPANYDLTFSRSEENDAGCEYILRQGGRVAMVAVDMARAQAWYTRQSGGYWSGTPVTTGDTHDLTFLHPSGILWLTPKGAAKQDTTGFVLR